MTSDSRKVDKLIDLYLSWLYSVEHDAGWHQPSMLQTMIEYAGDIPPPTGNDQADLKMMNEIRWLRDNHALLSQAKELIGRLPEKYRLPLLAVERYQGCLDENNRRWTAYKIAQALHLPKQKLVHRHRYGRQLLSRMIREG